MKNTSLVSLIFEYSQGQLQKLFDRFNEEGKKVRPKYSVTMDDVVYAATRFDQVKEPLKKKMQQWAAADLANAPIPEKFKRPDPKTGKVANYLDINNYTWKELEYLIDLFPKKDKKSTNSNTAEAPQEDLDLIYSKDGIEIYQADTKDKCIRFTNDMGVQYNFCIGRKDTGANMYYRYRFGEEDAWRNFYFVFNRNQSSEKVGDVFKDWYHVFVIHVGDRPNQYGVTDAVNQYTREGSHEKWPTTWEGVGQFMYTQGKESGKQSWMAIRGLKDLFKYIPPPEEEVAYAALKGRKITLEQFIGLPHEIKTAYIQDRNELTPDMFKSLDVELKNLAINSGHKLSYDELKSNTGLLKRYANYRFTRHPGEIIPVSFIPYLPEEKQLQYYEEHKEDYMSFNEVEKYFNESVVREYVAEQVDNYGYLPEKATEYMTPEQKSRYDVYNLLYINSTPPSEQDIESLRQAEVLTVEIQPLTLQDYRQLTGKQKEQYLKLVNEMYKQEGKYLEQLYAVPEIIEINGKYYLYIINSISEEDSYYVLADLEGNIVLDNIIGLELYKNGTDIIYTSPGAKIQKYTGKTTWQVPQSAYDSAGVYTDIDQQEPELLDPATLTESRKAVSRLQKLAGIN